MNRSLKKLGEILIEKKLVTAGHLQEALEEQRISKEFLGRILLKNGWIGQEDFLSALSEQFDIPVASLKDKYIDWKLVKEFSASLVLDYRCFPIKRNDWSLTCAITNPLDAWAIKRAEEEARGLRLKLVLVSDDDMDEAIFRYRKFLLGDISRKLK